MDRGTEREQLLEILRQRSYREGDFTLASGRKSKFYIDVKTTSLWPDGARLIGSLAWGRLEAEGWSSRIDAVAGLTLGADPLITSVSLEALSHGRLWPGLIVRKDPKGHGTLRFIEGLQNVVKGARVLVVEDVVTTGESGLLAAQRCLEADLIPMGVLAVVDREEGGRENIEARGLSLLSLVQLSELRTSC